MKYILIAFIVFLIAPVSFASADACWGWGYTNYWSGGAIVFLILLLGLIGVAVYFVINQRKMRVSDRQFEDEAILEILKKRYAKGEITKQQFENMKKALL